MSLFLLEMVSRISPRFQKEKFKLMTLLKTDNLISIKPMKNLLNKEDVHQKKLLNGVRNISILGMNARIAKRCKKSLPRCMEMYHIQVAYQKLNHKRRVLKDERSV